ncbi:MAG: hypothetical protein R2713_20875 [Ilumatobacteraceae bacterium]
MEPDVLAVAQRLAAVQDDRQHVGEGLDVVDERRLAEQPGVHRERRLVARLAAETLDRVEDRRLLAADVGTGADEHVEGTRSRPHHVVAEQPVLGGDLDGSTQRLLRPRVLAAQVHVPLLATGGERRDRHRLDERERIALQIARSLNVPGSLSSALQTR